jgi:hypothetical protein
MPLLALRDLAEFDGARLINAVAVEGGIQNSRLAARWS